MFAAKHLNRSLVLGVIGVLLLLGINLLPADAAAPDRQATNEAIAGPPPGGPKGSILVGRLNIRSGPSTRYPSLGVARYHEVVSLTGRTADFTWLQLRRDNGQEGWGAASYINVSAAHISALPVIDVLPPRPIPPTPVPPPPSEPIGTVTTYRLYMRAGPSPRDSVIGVLRRGQSIYLVGRNTTSTWLQIRLSDNRQGWASARYIFAAVPIHTLPITGGEVPNPHPDSIGYVTVSALNVRSGPGVRYGIMGWVYRYQRVRILDRSHNGRWLKVEVSPNYLGWVSARWIQSTVPDPMR